MCLAGVSHHGLGRAGRGTKKRVGAAISAGLKRLRKNGSDSHALQGRKIIAGGNAPGVYNARSTDPAPTGQVARSWLKVRRNEADVARWRDTWNPEYECRTRN